MKKNVKCKVFRCWQSAVEEKQTEKGDRKARMAGVWLLDARWLRKAAPGAVNEQAVQTEAGKVILANVKR